MIKTFNSLFVTMFGLGKIKFMPGTFGSLATVIILYYLFHTLNISPNIILFGLIITFIYSFYAVSSYIENSENKDPGEIIKQTIKKGYLINNLDINIITQKPKIQKYKKQITNCIAKICNISPTQINIKGKTTEKLGVIGKEKAIACEVIASVIKND